MEEPIINAQIFTPPEFVGPIMELCQFKRGVYKDMVYLDKRRVQLKYTLPLNKIIYDFFDQLKSKQVLNSDFFILYRSETPLTK